MTTSRTSTQRPLRSLPGALGSDLTPAAPTGDTLKSVTTALDVLDCFLAADELGVSTIARELGIAKSSAHRVLSTLVSRGFVEKNPESGRYRLGLHAYEIGTLAKARHPLHGAALPLLEELRYVTGHTVHLGVMDDADVLYLERLESPDCVRLMASAPRRWPAHCTSSGKAIAAFNPSFADARRATGFAIGSVGAVRTVGEYDRLLDETRRRGVGITEGGAMDGLSSVAAPIRDLSGRAYAAVSVVAPSAALREDLGRTSRVVTTVAGRLSRQLAIAS